MNEVDVQSEDDRLLAADWVRSTSTSPALASVVIHSATGAQRRYCRAFAQHLSEHEVELPRKFR